MKLTTRYQFNEKEFALPLKIHTWRVCRMKTLLVIGISLFFILFGLFGKSDIGPLLITFGVVYLVITLTGSLIAGRRITKSNSYNLTMAVEVTETDFVLKSDGLNSSQNWGLVSHAYIAKEGALIYQNKRMFNWFPFAQAEPETARDDLIYILERTGVTYTVE